MVFRWLKKRLARWAVSYMCTNEGHAWILEGGRQCPYSETIDCSQSVYRCARCKTYDYGDIGGPGWNSCKGCDLRPAPTIGRVKH